MADTSAADGLYEQWMHQLEEVHVDLRTLAMNRHVWWSLQTAIRENGELPPSYLFEYLRDTYAHSQAIGIRRQVDVSSGRNEVATLTDLLTKIRDNAGIVTLERFSSLYTDDFMREYAASDFARVAGGGELSSATVEEDLQRIKSGTKRVKKYVNKRLAHYEAIPSGRMPSPSFKDLDDALNVLEEVFRRYYFLFAAADLRLLPTFQYDLLAPLRVPWIP